MDFLQLAGKNVLVMGLANRKSVSLRTAAFMLAIGRVGRARVLGGI